MDLREHLGAIDLVVYTPEEWRQLLNEPSGFLQMARQEWVGILR